MSRAEVAFVADRRAYHRFLCWVDKTDTCWFWTGSVNHNGYGNYTYKTKRYMAHRFSYIMFKGDIAEKLQIDHLCRNRRCVNPDHLELVTAGENLLRSPWTLNSIQAAKTHCINGHIFDVKNTYTSPKRKRGCRACAAERARKCRRQKNHTTLLQNVS